MPPRPNSQSEPSSRRAISKSSKTTAAPRATTGSASSSPARSRQAKQAPFTPNGSPQTEQAVADVGGFAIALSNWQRTPLFLHQHPQELAQFLIHFCFGIYRPSHFGPQQLAVV